jgi:hypothetical protein
MLPHSQPSSTLLTPLRPARPLRQSWLHRPFLLRRWHFSLLTLVLLLPILGACLAIFLPSSIFAFLFRLSSLASPTSATSSPSAVGDLYWSLFGRDDTCCSYVKHADGYTLHYPSDPLAAIRGRSKMERRGRCEVDEACVGDEGGEAVMALQREGRSEI